jgi:hemerythrin-like domain-containing protein
MTTIDMPGRPNTHDMIVVHRTFRREAPRLGQLVEAVRDGDTKRSAFIADHYRDYRNGIHQHHSIEDELLWPPLLSRIDLEAESVLKLEAQHEAIGGTFTEVDAVIGAWEAAPSATTAAPVVAALKEHVTVLLAHLDDEEDILPLAAEHLTVEEWGKIGQKFADEAPKDKLLIMLGALLEDATEEERASILGGLPAAARLLWRTVGKVQYSHYRAKVLADLD